MLDHMYIK